MSSAPRSGDRPDANSLKNDSAKDDSYGLGHLAMIDLAEKLVQGPEHASACEIKLAAELLKRAAGNLARKAADDDPRSAELDRREAQLGKRPHIKPVSPTHPVGGKTVSDRNKIIGRHFKNATNAIEASVDDIRNTITEGFASVEKAIEENFGHIMDIVTTQVNPDSSSLHEKDANGKGYYRSCAWRH